MVCSAFHHPINEFLLKKNLSNTKKASPLPAGHVVATLSKLDHPTALLTTSPPFILCQAMQGNVCRISLLQWEVLVLFTTY